MDRLELVEPWYCLDDEEERLGLEEQLRRELTPGHVLFGVAGELIGRRYDCDDVLFRIAETGLVAVVHLAWTGPSQSPSWPSAHVLTPAEFAEEMRRG